MPRLIPLRVSERRGPAPQFALVDDDAYDELLQHQWGYYAPGLTGYASRPGPPAVQMHRAIMRAPAGLVVHHRNQDGLDNRRENLHVCTNVEHLRIRHLPGGYGTPFVSTQRAAALAVVLGVSVQAFEGKDMMTDPRLVGERLKSQQERITALEDALTFAVRWLQSANQYDYYVVAQANPNRRGDEVDGEATEFELSRLIDLSGVMLKKEGGEP